VSRPTVLLTGATGFLGSHMLEALLEKKYKVVVLKRYDSDLWRISSFKSQAEFIDIDKTSLKDVFVNYKVDVIIHMATLYKKYEELSDINEMTCSNVTFPAAVLSEGVKYGVKGFLNTGTFFEYDCSKQPVGENAPAKAFNFYAKTKLDFEAILKKYAGKICINTFKIFTPFGEKDNPKLVDSIIKKSLTNQEIVLSEGLQKLDLIYVKDAVNAFINSITRMETIFFVPEYETFNLGSGAPLSIRDIVSLVEESLGYRINVSWGDSSETDIRVAYADIEKAKRFLRWEPYHGVRAGISNCIKYYRNLDRI
jgi:UDP-glucose 4-epimerase